ncbi:hypothetical protein MPSEU_000678300 [Mayamaea pseudoterrestris]|nr:hypothetical protein MPSEU_000678300 [Mayamaea pseudoterrestris]
MCGINVLIHDNNENNEEIEFPDWLKRRGPDSVQRVTLTAATKSNITQRITLQSSVLNMRRELVQQPVCIQQDVYLAWNGEVYQTIGNDDSDTISDSYASEESDTNLVAGMIRQCMQEQNENQDADMAAAIVETFARLVNAAYALVVVTPSAIYYARDAFGRRSLLLANSDASSREPSWQLSSVSTGATRIWKEVEPGKLHVYQLDTQSTSSVDIVPSIPFPLLPAPFNCQPLTCMTDASMQLEQRLLQAVRRRVSSHNAVSVLFSGGLDSAVLAAMVLQVLAPEQSTLTLVNVCFVDDDVESHTAIVAADTLAARASYHDLQQRFPRHVIHLLESRVSWTEIQQHTPHIQQLAYPKSCSVMDLNIGTALWFAGRACPNRLIISGLGADELMGGYGRHRKAYMQGGAARLRNELDLDLERIWERNLGRDDRVLSDTAHEARFPFLDPHVVCYLKEIPLDLVCDYGLPPGQGDKRILRLVAERLGLPAASIAVKRAIQFGSRMSHVSDKHRYGSRRLATRTDTCSSAR